MTRGGARSNETLGKARRAPAATRRFSADRSSGTSSDVCTLSRFFATRISAGRARGANDGAEAAEGRVAANAVATSYAPGPGTESSAESAAESAESSSRNAFRRSEGIGFPSEDISAGASSRTSLRARVVRFEAEAREKLDRRPPACAFARPTPRGAPAPRRRAASGRNTTQGARRRESASEGIAGEA